MVEWNKEDASYRDYEKSIRIKCSDRDNWFVTCQEGISKRLFYEMVERNAEVLIFDEPTRGIDGGKV